MEAVAGSIMVNFWAIKAVAVQRSPKEGLICKEDVGQQQWDS